MQHSTNTSHITSNNNFGASATGHNEMQQAFNQGTIPNADE
jgi:hypothetical protein